IASMSAAYLEMNKLDTASYYIQRSKSLADSIDHQYGVAYSEALAGNVSLKRKEYDKALDQLIQAVELFKRMGIKKESASFSIQIAEIYVQTDNPRKALSVLDESAKIAEELRALFLLRDIYKTRADAHEKLGQMDLAYGFYKQHVQYKDSLLNEKRLAELAQIEHRHTVQEKNQEIATLQEQKANSQRRLFIFTIVGSVVILSGLLYLGYNRNRRLRHFNEELGLKNEEIRMQNQRLKASNEDLRQFAHVASHDLREPLRSIGSFTTLLRRRYYDKLDEDANEFINFISEGVNRMDMLLGDLLAYSVVGIFHTEYHQTDINTIITEIIANLNREKGHVGAKITIQNLPTITANRRQMIQLFTHLIDNAIKFRAENNPKIEISAQRQGNGYLFAVKDNGIGMDEAYTEKIFSLFLRLHTKKSQYTGTGIGLSICKKIVEQHRGRIWIDSHPGEGTTVFFTLPSSPLQTAGTKEKSRTKAYA
ncbi:MAG: ATP-binding protein, partial [Bacteroidota bacterium]